jgi:serine/threonine-protein kinase
VNVSAPLGIEMPARLGRYRLIERIGGGATSSVFAAHDDAADREVAVKMIVAELLDEPQTRERFYRESRVTAELRHENIVSVLDVGEDGGRPYLVMELLHGQPLGEYLRAGGGRTLAAQLDLIVGLCSGLQAAHDCGVVHRDIKPSNLFVQRDGSLKILDFGLARLQASTLTANGQILGTPGFMSPEQASGEKVDFRSDIFSAAAVGYLIVTGRAPFAGANLTQTLQAIFQEQPAAITAEEAPEALSRVLFKGLEKDPANRYQRAAEMRNDLLKVAA